MPTDLYLNCGVELTQSQQQQRPPAEHTRVYNAGYFTHRYVTWKMQETHLRAEALPSPGHRILKEERLWAINSAMWTPE